MNAYDPAPSTPRRELPDPHHATSSVTDRVDANAAWLQGNRPPYVPDHTALLDFTLPPIPPREKWKLLARVDAVIVPASRPAAELGDIARLARAAGKTLIILCSHQCHPDEVRDRLETTLEARVPVVIVDMKGYRWKRPARGLQLHADLRWEVNTALKRNVGLLIARRLGLRHVLFLDDDVFGLKGEWVRHAASLVASGDFRAAAWSFNDFPDNSAVSHAYRRYSGEPLGPQRCFVGGGGLLVGLDDEIPHFPLGIYNEDWLFLFDLLTRGKIAMMGELRQKPYAPFVSKKASAQEFGDFIAENLMTVLAGHRDWQSSRLYKLLASKNFWSDPLDDRRRFLGLLGTAIESRLSETADAEAILAASVVTEAADASGRIRCHHVRAWVNALHRDCSWWRKQWATAGQRPRERYGLWVQASFDVAIDRALADLQLTERAQVLRRQPDALRHRLPEQIRARVPARLKPVLIRAADAMTKKRPGPKPKPARTAGTQALWKHSRWTHPVTRKIRDNTPVTSP